MKHFIRCFVLLLALCLLMTACGKKADPTPTTGAPVITPDEPRNETPDEPTAPTATEPVSHNTQMLLSTADPIVDMEATKRQHYDNGSYYYMDTAGQTGMRCINSCYQTTIREGETEEEYAQRRAIGLSVALTPGNPYNLTVGKDDALSEALGYPVYLVSFLTGSDPNASCWTVYLTRTEHYSYQYAFCAPTQTSLQMEDKMMEYFATLKLGDLPNN